MVDMPRRQGIGLLSFIMRHHSSVINTKFISLKIKMHVIMLREQIDDYLNILYDYVSVESFNVSEPKRIMQLKAIFNGTIIMIIVL